MVYVVFFATAGAHLDVPLLTPALARRPAPRLPARGAHLRRPPRACRAASPATRPRSGAGAPPGSSPRLASRSASPRRWRARSPRSASGFARARHRHRGHQRDGGPGALQAGARPDGGELDGAAAVAVVAGRRGRRGAHGVDVGHAASNGAAPNDAWAVDDGHGAGGSRHHLRHRRRRRRALGACNPANLARGPRSAALSILGKAVLNSGHRSLRRSMRRGWPFRASAPEAQGPSGPGCGCARRPTQRRREPGAR